MTINPSTNSLNIIIGGLAFGWWQHSAFACAFALSLLTILDRYNQE